MNLKDSFLRHFLRVLLGLMLIFASAPCLYAGHDTALRTDLNFSYTFNEKFRGLSYAYLQADDEMSNYDYAEWGIGLNVQLPLPWLSFQVQYCCRSFVGMGAAIDRRTAEHQLLEPQMDA